MSILENIVDKINISNINRPINIDVAILNQVWSRSVLEKVVNEINHITNIYDSVSIRITTNEAGVREIDIDVDLVATETCCS